VIRLHPFPRLRRTPQIGIVLPCGSWQLRESWAEFYGAFLRYDEATGQLTVVDPDPVEVRVEIALRRARLAASSSEVASPLAGGRNGPGLPKLSPGDK
jgi:hypothetical protein